jgi:serine/threonine protein kinase
MTAGRERWDTIERLYHAALAQPAERRAAYLAEACAGDDALRQEVESLLAHGVSGEARLSRGAVVAAAGLVSDVGASALTSRRIGVYQLLAPIGAGGMGEVYRARDTRLGRDVAIKILPRAFIDNLDRHARFEREARVLASLNHPNIATIYGLENGPAEQGSHCAIAMELVDGETLAERIARGAATRRGGPAGPPMAIEEALDIARQIANALDAAHEKGIVHRDLKPANIKITPQGPAGRCALYAADAARRHDPLGRTGPSRCLTGWNARGVCRRARRPPAAVPARSRECGHRGDIRH